MTEVQQKPMVAGLVGTILVWILIFLFFYISALFFAPKSYKTIKIRLAAPQKVENGKLKTENSVQKAQANPTKGDVSSTALTETRSNPVSQDLPAAPSLPTPSLQSPSKNKPAASKAASSKPEATKPAPTKTVEKPKMVEQQLQKSMEELIVEQQSKKSAKKEFDWSQFDEMEGNSSSSNSSAIEKNTPQASVNPNVFSGSAASSDSQSTATSAASSNNRSSANQSTSAATSSALAGVVSANRYSSSSGNVSSTVSANTGSSSDGKVSLEMSDGKTRILLEPSEPKIELSREAAALIDSTKRLTVSFTVMASGNVPVTSVKISPDILPSLVSNEIREEISRWRFQAASYDGIARFEYTIQKN